MLSPALRRLTVLKPQKWWTDFSEFPIETGLPTEFTIETGTVTKKIEASEANAPGSGRRFNVPATGTSSQITWDLIPYLTDMDVVMLMRAPQVVAGGSLFIGAGCRCPRGSGNINGYYMIFSDIAGGSRFRLYKDVNGTVTQLGADINKVFVEGEFWWMRISAIGTTISGKAWKAGTAEPSAYDTSATDSTFTTGTVGWRMTVAGNLIPVYYIGVAAGTQSAPINIIA